MNVRTSKLLLCLVAAAARCLLVSPSRLHAEEAATLDPAYQAALRDGDANRVRQVLEQGTPVNASDARGNTALMLAAVYGDAPLLNLLLDRGAAVNATNAAGATALHRAATDPAKVRLLVERAADIQARSALGNSALHLAARPANSHEAVRFLLERGANARATNRFGATPLMAAAAGGDLESVRLLLRHGADVNARPNLDQPGFLFGGGRSALMWAAFRGNLPMMRLLLESGADVNLPGLVGTALAQATWADRKEAVELLLARGAQTQIPGFVDGYTPLHWAASSEQADPSIVKLLLAHGANPNLGGGESVDAFMATPQTPLMLAKRRGDTPVVRALVAGGATSETPDRVRTPERRHRTLPAELDTALLRAAVSEAVVPLQETSLTSKQNFLRHGSHQDCTSCHQQHLPLTAIGHARRFQAQVNTADEQALVRLVQEGEIKDPEIDLQPLFHPDPVMTKGYELFAYAGEQLGADANSDAWVHHLAAIQAADGAWYNNLPRPPIQTGDIGATALAIHALQRYPLPARRAELAARVERARQWLRQARAEDTDSRVYQLLGLAWAGETAASLQPLADALLATQRSDGGWSQLPALKSDAFATGQALYALRVATGLPRTDARIDRGLRFLLDQQLADGTWHVARRAFPFQPTMNSGFPHGRDSWISAAATSWAVVALSLPDDPQVLARATAASPTAQP